MSIEAIKKALEGVSHAPGPWKAIRMSVYCNDTTGKRVADTRSEHHLWDDGQRQQLAIYIAAVNPPAISDLISEIDRLQRENEALLEDRYKLACAITGGEDAPGLLDSTPTSEIVEIAQHARRMHQGGIDRAMAAEAEVARLQTELALSKPLYSRRQIEARVRSLEEALKPFAKEAENWSDSVPDDHKTLCTEPGSSTAHPGSEAYFTVGDLRRARTTLASTGGEHHGN